MAADSNVITRKTTSPRNLIKPQTNLEIQTNFFSAQVVDSWNAVPTEIKMTRNPYQFKKLYKAHRCGREGR